MKTLKLVIMYTLLIYGLALLSSCAKTEPKGHPNVTVTRSITVLENGDRDYVDLSGVEYYNIHHGDTVWVNLETHHVDDTTMNTMQCVVGEFLVAY